MSGLGQNIHLLHFAAAAAVRAAEGWLAVLGPRTPLRGHWCLSVGRQPRDPRWDREKEWGTRRNDS